MKYFVNADEEYVYKKLLQEPATGKANTCLPSDVIHVLCNVIVTYRIANVIAAV